MTLEQDKQTSGSESPEALFRKELERRGLSGSSRDRDEDRPSSSAPPRQKDQGLASPKMSADQLEKPRALNSEGIEGLIPRLTELAKLGLTFFLAFGPLILVTLTLFGGLYSLFGDDFIHGGRTSRSIPYVDPQELLNEPTIDPTIPFR
ncbi:hypothetical protein WJX73_000309 [Symbiochloris irregularis]|uniref:Uncharacterized protein n=1 Tax=Symbiochloris irregularis TaxID=706552 RepID=A0AAW1NWS3_9CHLO